VQHRRPFGPHRGRGLHGLLPDAARIAVAPGTYRARIFYGKLDSLRSNGLEGDDHYRVVFWPTPAVMPRVLKKRP
jgi:hypothetical protein